MRKNTLFMITEALAGIAYAMRQIEIETLRPERAPLPATESGYRSIFITALELEDHGGVKALVFGMLDETAQKRG